MVLDCVLAQVEQVAARSGVRTSHSEQRFVQTQVVDTHTSIWPAAN